MYDGDVHRSNENGNGVDDTVILNGIVSTSESRIDHDFDCATEFASGNDAGSENETDFLVDLDLDSPNFNVYWLLLKHTMDLN